ncbi:MAG: nucleotide sugar dehydrogenase, partial [Clostridium sp.]
DVDIAFMNELSMIFDKMNINTKAVIEAAATKWNFIKLNPGLVGGHCIGVDPYYLTYRANELGIKSKIISSAREINDGMSKFVVESTIKQLIKGDKKVKGAKVAVLGITFKEDCPDIRNSKVIDIINDLRDYDINVIVSDPVANCEEVKEEYGIDLVDMNNIKDMDAIIMTVSHSVYRNLHSDKVYNLFKNIENDKSIVIDVKGILKNKIYDKNTIYWSL